MTSRAAHTARQAPFWPSVCMDYHTFQLTGQDEMIERLHALFAQWETEDAQPFDPPIDGTLLLTLKLAMHEWLANLVQHADFGQRTPQVRIALQTNGTRVCCFIEDNSEGFDLDGHLEARPEVMDAFPERGMGLLMIRACTEDLSYRASSDDRHRLEFCISADQDPWLNIPF